MWGRKPRPSATKEEEEGDVAAAAAAKQAAAEAAAEEELERTSMRSTGGCEKGGKGKGHGWASAD